MSKKGTVLYCFSPPVMLLSFAVELFLIFYAFWRYKLTTLSRIALLMLSFLAIFQLSEFMLCGGLGFNGIDWIRFGYVSITALPPLGLHMVTLLAGKRLKSLLVVAYTSAAAFAYFFVFVTGSLNGQDCLPNYAVFHVEKTLLILYVFYYYSWLILTGVLALYWAQKSKHKKQLIWFAAGYAAFIGPTTIANVITPATVDGIPSIMCGFAVLMAIAIVAGVLPGAGALRQRPTTRK